MSHTDKMPTWFGHRRLKNRVDRIRRRLQKEQIDEDRLDQYLLLGEDEEVDARSLPDDR